MGGAGFKPTYASKDKFKMVCYNMFLFDRCVFTKYDSMPLDFKI